MKPSLLLCAGLCLAIVGGVERRDPGTKRGKVKLEKGPERSAHGKVKFSATLDISEEAADGTKATKTLKRVENEKLELTLRSAKKKAQTAAYVSDDASMLEVCPDDGGECELYGLIIRGHEDCIISANNEVCEKGPSGKDIDKFDEVLGEPQRKRSSESTLKQLIARELKRIRRQASEDYFYVEVCVLADLAWFEMTTRVHPVGASATQLESATLLLIAMMNVVNHMYSTMNDRSWRIEVVLRDYIIATNEAESSWSRPSKRGTVRANQIWKDLPGYIETFMNTDCDSYMALTGNDLRLGYSILGVAYLDSVCKPLRHYTDPIAITEGLFRAAIVFAHELGHQFGVDHTPEDTTADCSNPIQTMYPYVGYPEQGFYGFSECSKDGFERFLNDTQLSACLRSSTFNNNTRVDNLCIDFTGAWLSASDQCLWLTGSSAFMTGYSPADVGEAMCYTFIQCAEVGVVGRNLLVEDGTPCATNKVCYEGTCQTNAPTSDCPVR